MAHLEHYKRGGASGIVKHDERTENDKVEARKNECINLQKTHLNYNLAPARKEKSITKYVENFCSEHNIHLPKRKDLNIMSSWVVTLPADVKKSDEKKFFEATYNFLNKKYPGVITSMVHLDETTPHMHYAFIPIYHDRKNNILKVSSKNLFTRQVLRDFHKDLSAEIEKELGYKVSILTNETRVNKSIKELKQETIKKELELQNKIDKDKIALERTLDSLKSIFYQKTEIDTLEAKKTFTGELKLSRDVFEKLKENAKYGYLLNDILENLEKREKILVDKEFSLNSQELLLESKEKSLDKREENLVMNENKVKSELNSILLKKASYSMQNSKIDNLEQMILKLTKANELLQQKLEQAKSSLLDEQQKNEELNYKNALEIEKYKIEQSNLTEKMLFFEKENQELSMKIKELQLKNKDLMKKLDKKKSLSR